LIGLLLTGWRRDFYDLQSQYMLEALIAGGEREAVLLAEGRYPDVVLLNGDATLPQERGNLSEDARGLLIEMENLYS